MIYKPSKSQCSMCVNYIGVHQDGFDETSERHICTAFGSEHLNGIPKKIMMGIHDHREPYPGDNGIRFEPIQDSNA